MTCTTCTLEEELLAHLQRLAQERGISLSALLREAAEDEAAE
jgi:hypothetical protein